MTTPDETERLRRWRLLLGEPANDALGVALGGDALAMDHSLQALYDSERTGGLGSSVPNIARWLGDIRSYFPSSVVRVMQQDALERLRLKSMLLEPELLEMVEADVQLVGTLMSLKDVMPQRTRDTARQVVQRVVDDLIRRLREPMREAVQGSLNRAQRNRRPRHHEIDWQRTIRANLRHYQPAYHTIIPEQLIGYGRKRTALRDVVLCVDQSGSMASSVVYAGIFGAVMASLPALATQMIVFDTAVVDLTETLHDPVELLFGVQLGGGTDISQALGYCQQRISRPTDTILVLISDLYEGGNRQSLLHQVAALVGAGVQMIALLALSDDGAPSYDHSMAQQFAERGVPAFACTPDRFPDLMAAVLNKQSIAQWAAMQGIVTSRAE